MRRSVAVLGVIMIASGCRTRDIEEPAPSYGAVRAAARKMRAELVDSSTGKVRSPSFDVLDAARLDLITALDLTESDLKKSGTSLGAEAKGVIDAYRQIAATYDEKFSSGTNRQLLFRYVYNQPKLTEDLNSCVKRIDSAETKYEAAFRR